TDQDKAKVEHFQNKFKLKSFVVLDPQRKIQEKFQIYGVPTLVRLQPEAGKLTVRAFQAGAEIEKLLQ
ncbi:MAG: TlpA family protein disulfide reductase, partial [Pseudobdellovibrionaceae bacterium]